MVFAIEPMVTVGSPEVRMLDDEWTAVTADGSLAAHFEHTILITEHGPGGAHADRGIALGAETAHEGSGIGSKDV